MRKPPKSNLARKFIKNAYRERITQQNNTDQEQQAKRIKSELFALLFNEFLCQTDHFERLSCFIFTLKILPTNITKTGDMNDTVSSDEYVSGK